MMRESFYVSSFITESYFDRFGLQTVKAIEMPVAHFGKKITLCSISMGIFSLYLNVVLY